MYIIIIINCNYYILILYFKSKLLIGIKIFLRKLDLEIDINFEI